MFNLHELTPESRKALPDKVEIRYELYTFGKQALFPV